MLAYLYDVKFAITDIETTGSYAGANSITEIAIVITDGKQELDRFETLLQPDQSIPYHITQLTGITNEMVAEAPRFDEMADEIEDFLSDCIFVAHNVGFDYSFIKKQFEDRGRKFNPTRLCTVRSTRKIVPGLKSYSLSNLCTHFGVRNKSAHRAMADVEATVEIFHRLLEMDKDDVIISTIKKGNPESWLPNHVDVQNYHDLSESPGVYYFRDAKGKLLYIGMSGNVKKRVRQHFTGKLKSNRRQEFLKDIAHIDHVELGSEFIARIWEDHEIKNNWPKHNRAQKHPTFQFGVVPYLDQMGYTRWSISKLSKGMTSFKKFSSAVYGREWLFSAAKQYDIHPLLFGLPSLNEQDLPHIDKHQEKLELIKTDLLVDNQRFILIENGRRITERAFIAVSGERVLGFGFIDLSESIESWSDVTNALTHPIKSNSTVQSIVMHYLEKYNPDLLLFEDHGEEESISESSEVFKSTSTHGTLDLFG